MFENDKFILKKSLGQNFINDSNITNKIIKMSLPFSKFIIEVGPGHGTLTKSILKYGGKNISVIEKDYRCIEKLEILNKEFNNKLNIINADALKYPFWKLGKRPRQIISNLPYNISTKILINILRNISEFQKITLMFQKEVAQRIIALPGNHSYGRLSILTQLLTKPRILFDVPKEAFTPKPKVISTVILLEPKISINKTKFNNIEKTTQIAFSKRRKMLRTIFRDYGGETMLNKIGLCPKKRPENLTINEFCKLSDTLFLD